MQSDDDYDDDDKWLHEWDDVDAFPKRYVVCSRCQGHGHHSNPSIDGNGITQSEWAEWDDEEKEMYFSGGYDVTCYECNGKRVVEDVDVAMLSDAQYKRYSEWLKQKRYEEAERRAELTYTYAERGY
jgi:hypothetical protein